MFGNSMTSSWKGSAPVCLEADVLGEHLKLNKAIGPDGIHCRILTPSQNPTSKQFKMPQENSKILCVSHPFTDLEGGCNSMIQFYLKCHLINSGLTSTED